MSSFRDDSDYIRIEEFEAGCCRFKINYKELEKRISYSPFMSPEISSGRVHWHLRYSNASFAFTSIPRGSASLDIYMKTINDQKNFELSLLDKAGNPVMTVSQGASAYNNIPLVIMKVVLEEVALVDGWFFVECKTSEAVPKAPSQNQKVSDSLPEQLCNILKSGEMTDVTVEVNGELFFAHRSIIGARSPVFKAQLFGSTIKGELQYIRIEDMETEIFRHLLHYIYTDTVEGDFEIASTNLAQRLLIAADRYGIEGLRKKCEERLCKGLSLDSVLSYFALAEQYKCSKLRNACFKFVIETTNLLKLEFTEEYFEFFLYFPGIVAEFHQRAKLL